MLRWRLCFFFTFQWPSSLSAAFEKRPFPQTMGHIMQLSLQRRAAFTALTPQPPSYYSISELCFFSAQPYIVHQQSSSGSTSRTITLRLYSEQQVGSATQYFHGSNLCSKILGKYQQENNFANLSNCGEKQMNEAINSGF